MPFALRKGGWAALGVQALLLPLFALSGQVGAVAIGCSVLHVRCAIGRFLATCDATAQLGPSALRCSAHPCSSSSGHSTCCLLLCPAHTLRWAALRPGDTACEQSCSSPSWSSLAAPASCSWWPGGWRSCCCHQVGDWHTHRPSYKLCCAVPTALISLLPTSSSRVRACALLIPCRRPGAPERAAAGGWRRLLPAAAHPVCRHPQRAQPAVGGRPVLLPAGDRADAGAAGSGPAARSAASAGLTGQLLEGWAPRALRAG